MDVDYIVTLPSVYTDQLTSFYINSSFGNVVYIGTVSFIYVNSSSSEDVVYIGALQTPTST